MEEVIKMTKKIIGLITTFFVISNIFFSGSIVGENICKKALLDDYNVSVSCDENYMTVYPFETAVYGVKVTNTGEITDTYILDCPDLIDCCYLSSLNFYEISLNPGESGIVILTVQPYWLEENTYTITVRATSTGNPMVSDSVPTYTTVILDDRIIDVSSDKSIYNPGEPVILSLKNIDDQSIEGNPTFEVYNENNELVYGCYPDCWIILDIGEEFLDVWYPNLPLGKYTIEGLFYTYTDLYTDDASFFILDNNPIEVTTDKNIYESGEIVNLKLTNIGDKTIGGNPSFLIYNFNEDLIYEVYIYLWIELDPNEAFNEIWWDQKDKNGNQVPDGGYRLIGQFFMSDDKKYVDDYRFYIGDNLPPAPPGISGPDSGTVGVKYDYEFMIPVDPEGDLISLRVDWGIGGPGKWHGPFQSGTIIPLSYTWNKEGTFTIRAQAMDTYGSVSEWATFEVTIPRNKNANSIFFIELFNCFPNLLPILRLIL